MTVRKEWSRFVLVIAGALMALSCLATVTPTPALASCGDSGKSVSEISKDSARSAIQCLFNKERGGRNVQRNGKLEAAAQNHTNYMVSNGCEGSHQCAGESSLTNRVKRTGYSSSPYAGEIIIQLPAIATPRQVVDLWMSSAPHRTEIERSAYRHVGVGIVVKQNGSLVATAVLAHK